MGDPKAGKAGRCDLLRSEAEALRQLGRTNEAAKSAAAALALAENLAAANPGPHVLRLIQSLSAAGRAEEAITAARRNVKK